MIRLIDGILFEGIFERMVIKNILHPLLAAYVGIDFSGEDT